MPVPPVKALCTHQPLDYIRAVILFTVTRDAWHCHRKCGGSRRAVGSVAKMAAVPVRVWTLPRWRLSQSESRRDVLFYAR